jgi:uncharacterized protein YcgL (UPF0745 family)
METNKEEVKEAYANFPENNAEFARWNQLVPAAQSLKAAIKNFKKSDKAEGPLLHVFNRSVVLLTLAEYRAEHGGLELSHSHNIIVFENWDKICEKLQKVTNALGNETRDAIKKVIDDSKKISRPLYRLCVLLKSQRKLEGQDVDEIRESIFEVSMYWRKLYPDKGIFLKLHHLEAHVLLFIIRYGFYGRGSKKALKASTRRSTRSLPTLGL